MPSKTRLLANLITNTGDPKVDAGAAYVYDAS